MAGTNGSSDMTCVRLRGLPWSCKEEDVKKFLHDLEDSIKLIHFKLTREGRPSGEAYVELDSAEAVEKATAHDNEHIGSRYIEVFGCKHAEMEAVMRYRGGDKISSEDAIVRLRGLPFGITKEEIGQFFYGLEIVPNGILLPVDMSGRSTGEAFVQFADPDISEQAMEKHMDRIGHRYIEVFRSSQDEVKNAMWKLNGPGAMPGGDPYGAGGDYSAMGPPGYGGMRGGYGGAGAGRARAGPYSRAVGPMGAAGYGMPRMPAMKTPGSYGYPGAGPMGPGLVAGMPPYGPGAAAGYPPSSYSGRGGGSSGHMVHMRGLPYRVSEQEIKDFFYPLVPANVTLGVDDSGRASGEADVEFYSHAEAVEAMKKDREHIGSRYVELFLDSATDMKMGMGGMPPPTAYGGMRMY